MFDGDRFWDYIIAAIFAMLGGLAKLFSAKDKKRIKWGTIISELFISGFVGLMALQAGIAMGIESAWLGVVCGAAGFAGVRALNGIMSLVSKKTGIDIIEKNDKTEGKHDKYN